MSRFCLWSLFWVNLLGTLYGYEWYRNQLTDTAQNNPWWQLLFVPDSPTASLFFTLAIFFLLLDRGKTHSHPHWLRKTIEALAVVASVKYGIWAVAMIFAGQANGSALTWQDWMLVCSHLGMAAEALLYARFFHYRGAGIALAAGWVFANDWVDYRFGVFPWLPSVLYPYLTQIQWFTVGLSAVSAWSAYLARPHRNQV